MNGLHGMDISLDNISISFGHKYKHSPKLFAVTHYLQELTKQNKSNSPSQTDLHSISFLMPLQTLCEMRVPLLEYCYIILRQRVMLYYFNIQYKQHHLFSRVSYTSWIVLGEKSGIKRCLKSTKRANEMLNEEI